jgi:predicted acetyltransferase
MSAMERIDIRPLEEEDFQAALVVSSAAFGEHATAEEEEAHRLAFPFGRALSAYEGGSMVGTSATLPLELSLPGGDSISAGGLTWVAVLPTHRRRGILTRLIEAQLGEMANHGETVSALIASEGNIYGRFGFGPATSLVSFNIERAFAALATSADDPGRVILLGADEAATQLPAIYESLRSLQVGAVSRSEGWWGEYLYDPPQHREGGSAMFHAKHETVPGIADGYVTYRWRYEWEGGIPLNTALVVELLAAGPLVYRALWDYVLHMDLCQTVSFSRGRVDEPLRWLLADPRRFRAEALVDHLWLRVLDIPRALAARAYGRPGRVVLEVVSRFPSSATDRFILDVASSGNGRAECASTPTSPDLSIDLDMLGAIYLGGVSLTSLAIAGRVKEFRPGAVEKADGMFRTGNAPYCTTEF